MIYWIGYIIIAIALAPILYKFARMGVRQAIAFASLWGVVLTMALSVAIYELVRSTIDWAIEIYGNIN